MPVAAEPEIKIGKRAFIFAAAGRARFQYDPRLPRRLLGDVKSRLAGNHAIGMAMQELQTRVNTPLREIAIPNDARPEKGRGLDHLREAIDVLPRDKVDLLRNKQD